MQLPDVELENMSQLAFPLDNQITYQLNPNLRSQDVWI